jgi:hypothetical protein
MSVAVFGGRVALGAIIEVRPTGNRTSSYAASELHRSFVGSRPLRVRLRFLRMTVQIQAGSHGALRPVRNEIALRGARSLSG